MDGQKELDTFDLSVNMVDHNRRLIELESDMRQIKPMVYDTQHSVKQIEKSVNKIEENSDQTKRYVINTIIGAVITGILAVVVFGAKAYLTGN